MIYIKSRVFKRCSSSFSFRTVRSPILRQPLSRRPGAGAAFDTVHRFSGVIVSQRARFYGVSAETKLGFMQRVAGVIFLLHCKRVHVPLVMPLFSQIIFFFLLKALASEMRLPLLPPESACTRSSLLKRCCSISKPSDNIHYICIIIQ